MKTEIFKERELPMAELEKIGLAQKGKLLITDENKAALLAGRRTNLIRLQNLQDQNVHIGEMEAKISLHKNSEGKLELRAHPVYHQPVFPVDLTDLEAEMLEQGKTTAIYKKIKNGEEPAKEYLFEFDPETREYLKTDTGKIQSPDKVNGEILTPQQRKVFGKGEEVELSDGTKFRYTGVDVNPVRANKAALIASILLDGGISYMAYQGIRSLMGTRQEQRDELYSEGYQKALADMKVAEQQSKKHNADLTNFKHKEDDQSREYTRSGHSR